MTSRTTETPTSASDGERRSLSERRVAQTRSLSTVSSFSRPSSSRLSSSPSMSCGESVGRASLSALSVRRGTQRWASSRSSARTPRSVTSPKRRICSSEPASEQPSGQGQRCRLSTFVRTRSSRLLEGRRGRTPEGGTAWAWAAPRPGRRARRGRRPERGSCRSNSSGRGRCRSSSRSSGM